MWIIKLLSQFYVIVFVLLLLLGFCKKLVVDRWFYYLSFLLALSMGVLGFCLNPGPGLDLYRLFNYVRALQLGSGSFFSKIWGAKGMMGGDSTQGMVGWNLFCYIVQGLGDVHWLPAFGCFLTFFNILYILVDYSKSKGYSSGLLAAGLLLAFMGAPIQYVFSGIRNSLAVSCILLALYLIFYKKRAYFAGFLLMAFAATVHSASIFALLPIPFVKLKRQNLIRAVALFSLPVIFALATFLKRISIPYLSLVINRILFYANTQYQYDRPEMIANIAVFLVVSFVYWYFKHKGYFEESNLQSLYMNAYYMLGTMMIGCAVHRDFTLRIGYIMGIAAVPALSKILYCEKKQKLDGLIEFGMVLSILVCCVKVYYDTFHGILTWDFG